MNIIECTIKIKNETQAHYERLAEAVTDKEVKRLFSLFAAAEKEHVEKLNVLRENMRKFEVQNLNGLSDGVCVYSPHVDLMNLVESIKTDSDACRYAEQEEKETIEFFDLLSSQTDNEQVKRICQLLANKERDHLKMLEEIYFFIEEPRTYLEWGEFSNLKSL